MEVWNRICAAASESSSEAGASDRPSLLMQRRTFVTGLAATAALVFAGRERAEAQTDGEDPLHGLMSTGYFQVPANEQGIIAILIGLLLPAVQKVRDVARPVSALGGSLMLPGAMMGICPSAQGERG